MTKQEKELTNIIESILKKKNIDGKPSGFYQISKKSTNNFEGIVKIDYFEIKARGKDSKSTIKKLAKELKTNF